MTEGNDWEGGTHLVLMDGQALLLQDQELLPPEPAGERIFLKTDSATTDDGGV